MSLAKESEKLNALRMDIWEQECDTPDEYTKKVRARYGQLTNVAPHYMLMRATARWGPYGSTWGMKEVTWRIVDDKRSDEEMAYYGTALATAATQKDRRELLRKMRPTVILQGTFFYPDGEFPIIVDGPLDPDEDTFKKLLTGARKKALSYLGFSADVWLGHYDDDYEEVSEYSSKQDDRVALARKMIGEAKTVESLDELETGVKKLATLEQRDELLQLIEERRHRLTVEL